MVSSGFEATRDFAQKLDSQDPLAPYRERFHIPRGTKDREWGSRNLEEFRYQPLQTWARGGSDCNSSTSGISFGPPTRWLISARISVP